MLPDDMTMLGGPAITTLLPSSILRLLAVAVLDGHREAGDLGLVFRLVGAGVRRRWLDLHCRLVHQLGDLSRLTPD